MDEVIARESGDAWAIWRLLLPHVSVLMGGRGLAAWGGGGLGGGLSCTLSRMPALQHEPGTLACCAHPAARWSMPGLQHEPGILAGCAALPPTELPAHIHKQLDCPCLPATLQLDNQRGPYNLKEKALGHVLIQVGGRQPMLCTCCRAPAAAHVQHPL